MNGERPYDWRGERDLGVRDAYEKYFGRWSRKIAREFLVWLEVSRGQTWGDVGCGSGALVDSILAGYNPKAVLAIDESPAFIAEARRRIDDRRVCFEVGDATSLPLPNGSCDVTVSGLVLNFVSDAGHMAKEMARVTRPGGKVAAYGKNYEQLVGVKSKWDPGNLFCMNKNIAPRV